MEAAKGVASVPLGAISGGPTMACVFPIHQQAISRCRSTHPHSLEALKEKAHPTDAPSAIIGYN